MLWVYIAIFLMVIIFYFDQRIVIKRRNARLEQIREEEAVRWFNELKEEHPEFYEKVFGDKEDMH